MSDERVSVRKSTRTRLRNRKEQRDERLTYSDQIREIIPDPENAEPMVHDEDTPVTISLDEDAYDRVDYLAGDGVPLREVIEFFLYLDELDASVSPEQVLREAYQYSEQTN